MPNARLALVGLRIDSVLLSNYRGLIATKIYQKIHHMKKTVNIFLATLVLIVAPPNHGVGAQAETRPKPVAGGPLTDAERTSIRESLPRALFWFSSWTRPRACERKATINLQVLLADYEGKEVRVHLEVSDASVFAIVDEFKHRITFRRSNGVAYPIGSETFCEDNYASYLKNKERRMRDDEARAGNVPTTLARKEAETRDLLARAGIGKTLLTDTITAREDLNVLIPEKWSFIPLVDAPRNSPVKLGLSKAILKAAANDPDFNCEKGQTAELWIPEFDERDPGVYVRVQERPGRHTIDGISIVFFGFGRKADTGVPTVVRVARFDHIDDVYFFSGRITDLTYSVEKAPCEKP